MVVELTLFLYIRTRHHVSLQYNGHLPSSFLPPVIYCNRLCCVLPVGSVDTGWARVHLNVNRLASTQT